MAVLWGGFLPLAAQESGPLACTSCLVLELDAAEVARLLAAGAGNLEGLVVYVRDFDGAGAQAAADRLATAGAESGVILDPAPGTSGAFQMRTAITSLRSAALGGATLRSGSRTLPIAIDADSLKAAGIDAALVAPYADVTIAAAEEVGQWRRLAPLQNPSVEALALASLTPGAERLVVPIRDVAPAVLQAFARLKLLGTEVREPRSLTADEIVARYQAQQRRQADRIDTSIAEGMTTLMFEVPGMSAPVVITASTIIYRTGNTVDVEQRDIRVNGAAIGGGSADRRPQLPLLEPERAAMAPLSISLTDAFRYVRPSAGQGPAKAGHYDGVGDDLAVDFMPLVNGRTLPTGTAWFDPRSFALRRIERRQTGLRAPIVSSEQVEELAEYESSNGPVWLPWRTRIYDVYEAAGHRTPVQRQFVVDRYVLNAADFPERLAAAHASPHVMMRDTPDGLRYLVRRADGDRAVLADPSPPVRAVVVGLLVDPNVSQPLPFAGVSYLDLNWLGRGQLNAFVAGTYGQLSWSIAPFPASRWNLEGSAFAIAVPYNDRVFREGREQYAENLERLPMRASAGVAGPLARNIRLRGHYSLDVTRFGVTASTASDFHVPSTAIVHGATVALEAVRGPWNSRVWWNPAWRQGPDRAFQRGGLRIGRTVALGTRVSAGISGDWVLGRHLDRFSLFAVDEFENRIHGYPAASIRYDRGLIVRSTAGWSSHGWRVNGFADFAAVRDAGFGRRVRAYPGFGAALATGGPLRMLWSLDWGYGPRAIGPDGGVGTQTWRITGYRPF